jgi:hypothetical protein
MWSGKTRMETDETRSQKGAELGKGWVAVDY